ncbi:hypothetical protein L210DRAFT_3501176 [Boletus edulis BED1]|uniref:Uncharacterized protein n=1 Tax=Boletus edulis BED1 TaxID=1328754 RepID=A0AAD4C2Z1_BOLED|nr:hypothetical protein L210DRAFT_3501176 [Boletus edulis BED1]
MLVLVAAVPLVIIIITGTSNTRSHYLNIQPGNKKTKIPTQEIFSKLVKALTTSLEQDRPSAKVQKSSLLTQKEHEATIQHVADVEDTMQQSCEHERANARKPLGPLTKKVNSSSSHATQRVTEGATEKASTTSLAPEKQSRKAIHSSGKRTTTTVRDAVRQRRGLAIIESEDVGMVRASASKQLKYLSNQGMMCGMEKRNMTENVP